MLSIFSGSANRNRTYDDVRPLTDGGDPRWKTISGTAVIPDLKNATIGENAMVTRLRYCKVRYSASARAEAHPPCGMTLMMMKVDQAPAVRTHRKHQTLNVEFEFEFPISNPNIPLSARFIGTCKNYKSAGVCLRSASLTCREVG